jgi:3-keto-disaccharide hydrolase
MFDGTSLKNWDGDPAFWRAENGTIVGETTADKPLKENTFLIWRGGQPKDFELKLEYRLSATNSGIQYRSSELPEVGKWVLKGYQADIDFDNQWTGQVYEERGRGFLALRGQASQVVEGKKARLIGELESRDALKALIKNNDWNQFHIIARGNTLVHVVNGHVMAVVIDDDVKNRTMSGLVGIQIHVGPPMKIELRNIALKTL